MFYVRSTDGIKIAVYDYNPFGEETVVLIHGWPLSHLMYEYQTELLCRQGYRVVTLDLRGFGNSDTPAFGYSYDQMSQDIFQVIRRLKLKNFTLVGFSMGGAIVLRYMRKFKSFGVKKLILLAAAAPSWTKRRDFPYGLTREYVNELIELAETDRPQLCYNFSHEQLFASPQSEPAVNWFEQIALSASGLGTVRAAVSLRDEDGREDLQAVHVPTWIIHGKKDVVVSNELVRIQHDEICGSRLIQLDESGHGIVYDQLELFNKYFLKAVRT